VAAKPNPTQPNPTQPNPTQERRPAQEKRYAQKHSPVEAPLEARGKQGKQE
jgi:hypothetical protein